MMLSKLDVGPPDSGVVLKDTWVGVLPKAVPSFGPGPSGQLRCSIEAAPVAAPVPGYRDYLVALGGAEASVIVLTFTFSIFVMERAATSAYVGLLERFLADKAIRVAYCVLVAFACVDFGWALLQPSGGRGLVGALVGLVFFVVTWWLVVWILGAVRRFADTQARVAALHRRARQLLRAGAQPAKRWIP